MENQGTEGKYIEGIKLNPSADTDFAGVRVKKELIDSSKTLTSCDVSGSAGFHDTIDLSKGESFEGAKENTDGADLQEGQEELSYVSQCSPCISEIFFELTCVLRGFFKFSRTFWWPIITISLPTIDVSKG